MTGSIRAGKVREFQIIHTYSFKLATDEFYIHTGDGVHTGQGKARNFKSSPGKILMHKKSGNLKFGHSALGFRLGKNELTNVSFIVNDTLVHSYPV